ncbi:uncharacterized protein [Eurosta solidaginis]|uniref:uncharacterized protein isoform X2 n=1 Tax=Eurosta solidaginis TaxID=178769 RepID=UPI003530D5E1
MTSLNGDAFVMRKGRSTSQVSIYNYPEHLNPFYEEDQHKRLRFWQLKKSGDSGSRRNSFSLGGLKDVWAFKSFRLKKKSSTLGINKTSESPPPLRRDQYYTENGTNLSFPDYRTRYSTPVSSESFQRNAVYRSSLQSVASAKDNASKSLDFNRNNQYRSTIQVMGTKSNNNNNFNSLKAPVQQSRRSSQISMASTNPFDTDDDYEENNEDVSLAGDRQLITSTPIKKQMHRKKRRAPPPPVRGPNSSAITLSDCSLDASQEPQPLPELRIEECMDIANLTAAIESFVKTTSADAAESDPITTVKQHAAKDAASNHATPKQNGDAHSEHASTSPSSSELTNTNKALTQKPQIDQTVVTETNPVADTNKSADNGVLAPKKDNQTEVGHVECIHVHMENARTCTTPIEHAEPSQFASFRGSQTRSSVPQVITTKTSFTLTTPPTTRRSSTKKARVALPNAETLKFPETEDLKITEDATAAKASITTDTVKPAVPIKPHIAEIHKPARGITSTTAAAAAGVARDDTLVLEMRQAPLSPVPPIRHSSKLRQTLNAQPNEIELKLEDESIKPKPSTFNTTNAAPALTITESHENLLEKVETTVNAADAAKAKNITSTTQQTQPAIELREEALESLYRPKPHTSYMKWNQTSLAPLEMNVPPEKRKSVKDIIESINRSQRLLNAAAHKDEAHNDSSLSIGTVTSATDTPIMRRKFSSPTVIERNLDEMQRKEHNGNATAFVDTSVYDEELPSTSAALAKNESVNMNGDGGGEYAQDPQKLNNNDVFKKCIVKKEVQYDYREQSPTTSNLDWNPVPKPKRNKNPSEQ